MNRQLTNEETLYVRLMYAYNHYDGDTNRSFKENKKLLEEIRKSHLSDDFKESFEALWFDQVSKKLDIHKNYAAGLTENFKRLGFEKWL